MKSISEKSLEITSLFEAEVLVKLMLWRWNHPFAADPDFANDLLEDASMLLREAIEGTQVLEGVPPDELNFVAAVWCAEHRAVDPGRDDPKTLPARKAWLSDVRRALPSCFCDPSDLVEPHL